MKIVIIGTAYPHRGGIAHFNALLYRTFRKRGHDVRMISFTRQYPGLFFPGKTQYEKGPPSLPVPAEPLLDSIHPLSWIRVAIRVRQLRPDLVVFKYWMPFFALAYIVIASLVKAGRKTEVLYVCDNIIPHERRPGDRFLTRTALATGDHFLVMSKTVEQDLLRFKPDAHYIRVEHPVYEIFRRCYSKAKARRLLGIDPSLPVILFFGYIRRYKGFHLLLKALPLVLQQEQVQLLVAGEFYEDSSEYLNLIRRLHLEKAVVLKTEFIPDEKVGLFFSAADIVALPYVSATQSGVIQIAYHFDRPVVATPVGGLPEVVLQDKTGYVVSEISAPAIADGILRVLQLRKKVKFEQHIHEFKRRFSWEGMVASIEELAAER